MASRTKLTAFSVLNAMEAKMNLFYNQQLDYDLSEQDAIDCNPFQTGNCYDGGNHSQVLQYAKQTGIVNEICFPFINNSTNCIGKCSTPSQKVVIENYYAQSANNEELIKNALLAYGQMHVAFFLHSMCLVGYGEVKAGMTIDLNHSYGALVINSDSPFI